MRPLTIIAVLSLSLCPPAAWARSAGAQGASSAADPVTSPAAAQQEPAQELTVGNPGHNAEVTFFVGGVVGGDLATLVDDGFSLSSTIENGRTYGGRVGYYTFPLGVEGSFAYSQSGLAATVEINERTRIAVAARVMYAEVNGLLILIPGPVQPFITGGGGLHSYKIHDFAGVGLNKWGWNFGGGIKFNIKRVALRADVRDHLTRVTAADLGVGQELAELLGIRQQDLHNVEVSFGIAFRF